MQSVSSRIWTRVAVSISYDDNDYTTGTSYKGWYAIKPNKPNQTKYQLLPSFVKPKIMFPTSYKSTIGHSSFVHPPQLRKNIELCPMAD